VATRFRAGQRLKPHGFCILFGTAEQAAEKVIYFVIPNEVRNLSLV
jgi:hypothetical protein